MDHESDYILSPAMIELGQLIEKLTRLYEVRNGSLVRMDFLSGMWCASGSSDVQVWPFCSPVPVISPSAKLKLISTASIVIKNGMSICAAQSAMRKHSPQRCTNNHGFPVVVGSSKLSVKSTVTAQLTKQSLRTMFMCNNDRLGILAPLFDAFCALRRAETLSAAH